MTREESSYVERVVELGCIVCRNLGYGISPAQAHHPRRGVGMGQRSSHFDVIPLCPMHHQHGGWGVALHAGIQEFERRYGTEQELLQQTQKLLEEAQ